MSPRRAARLGAAFVAVLAASVIAVVPGSARAQEDFQPAQECSNPPPDLQEMSYSVSSPAHDAMYKKPLEHVFAEFENTSTRSVAGQFEERGTISSITARLEACRDGQVLPDPREFSSTSGTSTNRLSLDWTTEEIPTNGPFVVVLVAQGRRPSGSSQTSTVVVPFKLDVPPAKPTGVDAESAEDTVTVKWNANPEPDTVLYQVQRARQGSGAYQQIITVRAPTTTITDRPGEGAYRYRVLAIRMGAGPDGVASLPSNDATAEVASTAATTPAGGSTDGTGSTTSAGPATTASSGAGSSTTARPGTATTGGSTVDLSNFASGLNSRRAAPGRVAPPDPGFNETLPFQVPEPDEMSVADDPEELGADEPNVGLGQRVTADPGERRRSMGFVAGGFLLFVLSMTGLYLKSEVRRPDARDLEALDAEPDADLIDGDEDAAADIADAAYAAEVAGEPIAETAELAPVHTLVPVAAATVEMATTEMATTETADASTLVPGRRRRRRERAEPIPVAEATDDDRDHHDDPSAVPHPGFEDLAEAAVIGTTAGPGPATRRTRRTVAPIDDPSLDVRQPTRAAANGATRTPAHARRAPTRLPSRSTDDRRQGGAAVRPRRRRAGEGDGRVPVG